MDGTGITPVMPMGNGGFGDGFEWILGLVALGMLGNGGFGFGNGNNNANALQADVNRGFDNQNLQAQTRDILSAVNAGAAQAVAATNQTFHDTLMANQSLYNEVARDIAGLGVGQANMLARINECCGNTQMSIMQSNYDAAMRDAATNANFSAQIQSVKDMIAQNKIESLQNQVNQLQLQNAVSGVVRYPTSTAYAVPSPCFNGGCGCCA